MDQERRYKWIQDRIRELHTGMLSDTHRRELEELAKDDPFLQDALEGYTSASHADHSHHLDRLSYRIRQKAEAKRRRLFPTTRQWVVQAVAASLMLILVTWVVIYYLGKKETAVLVANTEIAEDSMAASRLNASPSASDLAMDESAAEESAPSGLRATAQEQYEAGQTKAETKAEDRSEVKADRDVVVMSETASKPAGELSSTTYEDKVQMDAGATANAMDPKIRKMRVTGKVVDETGQPLIGALVSVPNSNLATTSDERGRFEILIQEEKAFLDVTYTGYADNTVTVKQGEDDVVIVLNSGTALYETSAATKSKGSKTTKRASTSFYEYIQEESRFPVQNAFSHTAKTVTLTFTVNSNRRAVNIALSKSNAEKKYITEAMRLIEKGPVWTCEAGYPCEVEYTIYFQ